MDVKNLNEVPAFITKDGSEIRELLAHRNSVIRNQSLAEARVPVGGSTLEHCDVKPGDAIAIPPGEKHKIWNTGNEALKLLCCCSPAYEHCDTVITET
ncbi:MAG: hypothetical protein DME21_18015 [Verrucomicrobia bacterium]|nr:MAG: hypothetical protein DME21_18015 [Verrucomicrobiota bacterium]